VQSPFTEEQLMHLPESFIDVYGLLAKGIDPRTAARLLTRSETSGHGGRLVIPEEQLQERLEMLRLEDERRRYRPRNER
jgi:hypothetical protein